MWEDIKESLKTSLIILTILFAFYGIISLFYIKDYANEISYYENGIKLDAIEYHNEIYLKKGE